MKSKLHFVVLDFDTVLEFVEQVDKNFPDKVFLMSDIAKMLEVAVRNKSLTYKVSAAKQFGLIEKSKNSGLHLTELAKLIIHPMTEDSGEILKLKRKAFLNSESSSILYSRFKGEELPTGQTLANILLNDYKLATGARGKVATSFLKSIEQLGMDGRANNEKANESVHMDQDEGLTEDVDLFTPEDVRLDNSIEAHETNKVADNRIELVKASVNYGVSLSIQDASSHTELRLASSVLSRERKISCVNAQKISKLYRNRECLPL
ncbi:hypothetical protein [Levilactobacillus enshiensis]|uniref:hypothetical protein n=1 Tax=Levilactobacillus enshiensis TaxID=2590213 RepID=UPI00131E92D2|nr:hypothetical protein [Levilactobacillus enshiensis]